MPVSNTDLQRMTGTWTRFSIAADALCSARKDEFAESGANTMPSFLSVDGIGMKAAQIPRLTVLARVGPVGDHLSEGG